MNRRLRSVVCALTCAALAAVCCACWGWALMLIREHEGCAAAAGAAILALMAYAVKTTPRAL